MYSPYGRSNLKTISIRDKDEKVFYNKLEMKGEIFDINKLIKEFDDRDPKDVINELEKEHGDEINKTLIESWTHIWDYDFELDNFTSEELKNAINEVCKTNVSSKDIDNLKDIDDCKSKKGIKSLIGENCNKIEIIVYFLLFLPFELLICSC